MTTRPSFRPVAAPLDVDDKVLQALNEQLHVPALVKTQRRSSRAATPERVIAKDGPPSPSTAKDKPKAQRRSNDVRLAIDVPEYLRDAINLRAAQERSTSRHIIMQGLHALGFEIDDEDLTVDRRQVATKR